jgi:hypothetical protein
MRCSGQRNRRHPHAPLGGAPVAADRLQGLCQEQCCLIESCQWVSLAANTFPVVLWVVFVCATCNFNLTVSSMQRCPCFQAFATSSVSSESPEENKANPNRLPQTLWYSCLVCKHQIAATLVFFCLSFYLCFHASAGLNMCGRSSVANCDWWFWVVALSFATILLLTPLVGTWWSWSSLAFGGMAPLMWHCSSSAYGIW